MAKDDDLVRIHERLRLQIIHDARKSPGPAEQHAPVMAGIGGIKGIGTKIWIIIATLRVTVGDNGITAIQLIAEAVGGDFRINRGIEVEMRAAGRIGGWYWGVMG